MKLTYAGVTESGNAGFRMKITRIAVPFLFVWGTIQNFLFGRLKPEASCDGMEIVEVVF